MAKTYRTADTTFTGVVEAGGKPQIEIGTREVQFSDKDTTNTYVRVRTGNSANSLLIARKRSSGEMFVALAVEAKPGIVEDGVDTATQPAREYTLRSGRKVSIPAGHTVGIFGGYLNPSDASTLKGAMREALEETGIDVSQARIKHAGSVMPFAAWGDRRDHQYIVLLPAQQEFGPETGGDVSISGRYWFTFEDAMELIVEREGGVGGDGDSTPFAAHAPAFNALLAAHYLLTSWKL